MTLQPESVHPWVAAEWLDAWLHDPPPPLDDSKPDPNEYLEDQ